MTGTRTRFAALAAALLVLSALAAAAQDYPNRPVRLVVPFPPGGINDIVARVISQHLGERLGKQVVVDNRGGVVGAEIVANAPKDGHTLLIVSLATAVNPWLYTLPYDPLKSFAPISMLVAVVVRASSSREIDAAFASFARERPDALFISSDAFFTARRVQISVLTACHGIPTAFQSRDSVEVGGLISYGANNADTYRQLAVYAGRILKGAKPADMPVVQTNKFELVINTQTAGMLGITVPPGLLARADEVRE